MKKIQFYTICRAAYSNNMAVFGVTSVGPRGRVNGRFMDGFASHTTDHRCVGKFESESDAAAYVKRVIDTRKEFADRRRPYEKIIRDIENDERIAIEAILKEVKADGALRIKQ